MMGAEPLEVPHQSSPTEHQHQQSSLIAPSTLVEDGCWDSSSSNSKHSLSQQHLGIHHQVNGGQLIGSASQGSSSGAGANKGARRTRHRVDAGEPRGCFNQSSNPGFGFQPRNIFTSPISQQKSVGIGGGSPLVATGPNNNNSNPNSPFHIPHNHLPSPHHFLHHPNSYFPPSGFSSNKAHLNQEGQDAYYFQPMKMLSEYISSQQAAAAAAATAMANNAISPSGQNGSNPHQLLLREMLSKSSRNNNNNNNNNVTKSGYEEDVVSVMESGGMREAGAGSENNRPEADQKEDSDLRDDRDSITINPRSRPGSRDGDPDAIELADSEDENIEASTTGGVSSSIGTRSRKLKPVKLELLMENGGNGGSITKGHPILVNGHGNRHSVEVGSGSASSSVTSGNSSGAAGGGMRINGCKKRKLYQPQQRNNDFDEVDEEEGKNN